MALIIHIDELQSAAPLTGDELFIIEQAGQTVSVSLTRLAAFLGAVPPTPPVVVSEPFTDESGNPYLDENGNSYTS